MAELKNTFIQGTMNKDLDERLVPQGQYRDAQNITVETSNGSNVGAAQNSLGNTLKSNIATVSGRNATDARTIGSVAYEANNLLYWFVSGDYFDGIYEYDETTETTTRILQSNKTNESTPSKLNFRKEYLITGVNHIIGPDGNTFLYWTDDYNPPRRINISRAKSYNIDDVRIDSDINVILEPPLYSPHIQPFTDTSDSEANNMQEKFLYFAYRYVYLDNQYSSLSPFSGVAFVPKEYEFDYGVGNNKSMTNRYNACRVSFETGNEFVKSIQLVVADTRNLNVGIVDTYDKDSLPGFTSTGDSATVIFKNNKILTALPVDQVTRLFDNVPLLAKSQDIIGNRLAYGNYEQFRDIKDCDGNEIQMDFRLSIKDPGMTPSLANPMSSWRSDRNLEFALLYSDGYGRLTTALSCDTNSIYIPPANSTTGNQLLMKISNPAPCWATHYRLAVKQGQSKVYNIFPIVYYVVGTYRWFLISNSDIDKVAVGEYVIFKTNTSGPTQSNRKYKVLDVKFENTGGVTSGSIPGAYFKIKVDTLSAFSPSAITTSVVDTEGWGAGSFPNFNAYHAIPVYGMFDCTEPPIHYGDGDPTGVQLLYFQSLVPFDPDCRFTIEILQNNQFRYTTELDASGGWSSAANINQGATVNLAKNGVNLTQIVFTLSSYTPGDRWKINVRGQGNFGGNYFGGVGISSNTSYDPGEYGGGVIVNRAFTDPILPGSVIRIQILEDSLNPNVNSSIQQFPPSNGYYENIEEWFVESGAYLDFNQNNKNGINIKSQGVTFRRGSAVITSNTDSNGNTQESIMQGGPSDPMYMIIQGFGYDGNDWNKIKVKLSVSQTDTPIICETSPKDSDADIFHELSQTYPIDQNGNHIVTWKFDVSSLGYAGLAAKTRLRLSDKSRPHYFTVGDIVTVAGTDYEVLSTRDRYQMVIDKTWVGSVAAGPVILSGSSNQDQSGTFTPAVIELNTPDNPNCDFNAWSWGSGLESDRIYDDFNQTTIEYSQRATTVIDNYKKIRNDASICYSGVYNENTQYNRLNEFNLSIANFKYLDREFGSIQKLYARNTDLTVFQEKKVSSVLYGKNILFDSAGGGNVASITDVLGTQIPMRYEYGIGKAPESFAMWGDLVWFADPRNGVVIQMEGDSMIEVSSLGMKDYTRDLMRDNPNTQKLGAYDPYKHLYVLSSTSQRSVPCKLSISRNSLNVPKENLGYLFFSIDTDSSWTITAVDLGDGTNWVDDFATSGTGSQVIYGEVAANLSAFANREVELRVTYCDGITESFILTQARGRKGRIITLVLNSERPKK